MTLQQLVISVNKKHKFAHIGVYNMETKKGVYNSKALLSTSITESKRLQRVAGDTSAKSADKAFGNSFFVRIMNTGFEGWETVEHIKDISLSEASRKAADFHAEYADAGYSISGSMGNKSISCPGIGKFTTAVIKNATKSRLNDIVSKLVEGIEDINIPKVQNDIYRQYNYYGLDTRRKFWYFIYSNLDAYSN